MLGLRVILVACEGLGMYWKIGMVGSDYFEEEQRKEIRIFIPIILFWLFGEKKNHPESVIWHCFWVAPWQQARVNKYFVADGLWHTYVIFLHQNRGKENLSWTKKAFLKIRLVKLGKLKNIHQKQSGKSFRNSLCKCLPSTWVWILSLGRSVKALMISRTFFWPFFPPEYPHSPTGFVWGLHKQGRDCCKGLFLESEVLMYKPGAVGSTLLLAGPLPVITSKCLLEEKPNKSSCWDFFSLSGH